MIWHMHESQGSPLLDQSMAEELSSYLRGKESFLSQQILDVFHLIEGIPSLTKNVGEPGRQLNEVVEEFSRKIDKSLQSNTYFFSRDQWRTIANQVNEDLWEYVEVLEGCVTELFQQINRISFDQWHVDLIRVLTLIKDTLTQRMDNLIWAILRLEHELSVYQERCEKRAGKQVGLQKVFFFWKKILDRSLIIDVQRCNKFLNFRFRLFVERYNGYINICENLQQYQLDHYPCKVLSSMDLEQQDKLKEFCFYLTLWEKNNSARILSKNDVVKVVRKFSSDPMLMGIFKDYFSAIRLALFDKSRVIKKQGRLLFFDTNLRKPLLDNIQGYREELNLLSETLIQYKKFHVDTDPPKESFFQKIFKVAKKEKKNHLLKELHDFIDNTRKLDLLALNFHASLECEPSMLKKVTADIQRLVDHCCHEMGQPLASKALMSKNGKVLVTILSKLDEMGSFDPGVVSFIRDTLIKAMCLDWKYHVLQEIPLFHHIVEVHHYIHLEIEDRQQINQLYKFQRIFKQIQLWLDNNEALKRMHEIELEINNIKAYFQDFLAYIQRSKSSLEVYGEEDYELHIDKISNIVFQYLYLFGTFLHSLSRDDSEKRMIRKQFLFVDQYFEEIYTQVNSKNIF